MTHKYLSEIIDIEKTPYGVYGECDPRNSKWKEQREIYGFDERETWQLDHTFFCWLYERLKMYNEVNFVNTKFHTIEYDGKTLTHQECMDKMLEYCEIIILNKNVNDSFIALEEKVLDLWKLSYRLFWW